MRLSTPFFNFFCALRCRRFCDIFLNRGGFHETDKTGKTLFAAGAADCDVPAGGGRGVPELPADERQRARTADGELQAADERLLYAQYGALQRLAPAALRGERRHGGVSVLLRVPGGEGQRGHAGVPAQAVHDRAAAHALPGEYLGGGQGVRAVFKQSGGGGQPAGVFVAAGISGLRSGNRGLSRRGARPDIRLGREAPADCLGEGELQFDRQGAAAVCRPQVYRRAGGRGVQRADAARSVRHGAAAGGERPDGGEPDGRDAVPVGRQREGLRGLCGRVSASEPEGDAERARGLLRGPASTACFCAR